MASIALSTSTGYSGGTLLSLVATGTLTVWDTSALLTVTGGTGASLANQVVDAVAQTITADLYLGATAATLTIGDTEDAATATVAVSTPTAVGVNSRSAIKTHDRVFVTLAGADTSWSSATFWSATGGTSSVLQQWIDAVNQVSYLVVNVSKTSGTITLSNTTDDQTYAIVDVKAHKHRLGLARIKSRGIGARL